jgi:prepilin-type N-terminal cleavage/methylation domain-containing protein
MRMRSNARAGFTLIELLAVIMILGILIVVLLVSMTKPIETVEGQATRMTMQTIGLAADAYEDDQGDYPRSKLATEAGTAPNATNLGSECLYLALCAEKAPGFGKFEEHMSNSDEDQLAKRPTGFQVATLFELCDKWDNPIAYFHRSDYGREDLYVTIDKEGQRVEGTVKALKNPKTGNYYEALRFQMISAGPDGVFGGEDDVTNFKVVQ